MKYLAILFTLALTSSLLQGSTGSAQDAIEHIERMVRTKTYDEPARAYVQRMLGSADRLERWRAAPVMVTAAQHDKSALSEVVDMIEGLMVNADTRDEAGYWTSTLANVFRIFDPVSDEDLDRRQAEGWERFHKRYEQLEEGIAKLSETGMLDDQTKQEVVALIESDDSLDVVFAIRWLEAIASIVPAGRPWTLDVVAGKISESPSSRARFWISCYSMLSSRRTGARVMGEDLSCGTDDDGWRDS